MTPQEMHVEVLQGLHNVNADYYDEFLSGEIDLALNKMQDRFIAELLPDKPGLVAFQQVQRHLDKISPLIRSTTITYLTSTGNDINEEYIDLPADYLHLLADTSQIEYSCDDINKTLVEENRFFIAVQPVLDSAASSEFYKEMKITYNGTDILTVSDWATDGFADVEDKFEVIHLLKDELDRLYRKETIPFQAYWENYKGLNHPGSFIFVATDPAEVGKTIIISEGVNGAATAFAALGTGNRVTTALTGLTPRNSPNRVTEHEFFDYNSQVPYRKTHRDSPLSLLQEGEKLIVKSDETFILKGIKITYVRRPTRISLYLNKSCELPAKQTHQKIIDMTVNHLLERLESQRFQSSVTETNVNK